MKQFLLSHNEQRTFMSMQVVTQEKHSLLLLYVVYQPSQIHGGGL